MNDCKCRETCLLTTPQVAGLLCCSPRQVQRMVRMGKLPAPLNIEGMVRWQKRAVTEWLAAGCPPVSNNPDNPQGDSNHE